MDDETLEETKPIVAKVKKPRSQKQIEQFERIRAIRDANRKARAEEKALQEAQQKKEIEDKIVQKAIAIKKKQIIKQKVLEEISDDDTPIEEVKKIIKPQQKPQTEPQQQLNNNPRFFFC